MADETLIYTSKHYDSGEDIDAAIWHDNRDALDNITNDFINILKSLKTNKFIYNIKIEDSFQDKANGANFTITAIEEIQNMIIDNTKESDKERSIIIRFPFQIPTKIRRDNWNENLDYVLRKNGQWAASTNYWKKENNILSLNSNFFNYDNDYISLGYNPEDNNSGDPYKFVFGIGDSNTKISAFSIRKSGRIYARNFNPANLFGVIECYNSKLNPNEVRATLKNPKLENSIIESSTIQGDTKINNNIYSSSTVPFVETMPGVIPNESKTVIQEKYNEDYCRPIKIPYDSIPTGLAISTKIDNSINGSTNTPYLRIQLSNVKENDIKDIEIKSPNGSAITCAKIANKMITVRYYNRNFYLASGGGCDFLDIKTELTSKDIMNDDEWADFPIYIIGLTNNKIYGKIYNEYTNSHGTYFSDAYFCYDINTNTTNKYIYATGTKPNQSHEDPYDLCFSNENKIYETINEEKNRGYIINDNGSITTLYSIAAYGNTEKGPNAIYRIKSANHIGPIRYAKGDTPTRHDKGLFVYPYYSDSEEKLITTIYEEANISSLYTPYYIQIGNYIIGYFKDFSWKNQGFIGYAYPTSIDLAEDGSTNPIIFAGDTITNEVEELIFNSLFITKYNALDGIELYLINNNNQLIKYTIIHNSTTHSITRNIVLTYNSDSPILDISINDPIANNNYSSGHREIFTIIDNKYYIAGKNKLYNIFNDQDTIDLNTNTDNNIFYISQSNDYTIVQKEYERNKIYIMN